MTLLMGTRIFNGVGIGAVIEKQWVRGGDVLNIEVWGLGKRRLFSRAYGISSPHRPRYSRFKYVRSIYIHHSLDLPELPAGAIDVASFKAHPNEARRNVIALAAAQHALVSSSSSLLQK